MEIGFLSLEILCFLLLSTASYADINLGSTLQPTSNQNNNIWRSPNGNFSLQFIPVSSSSSFSVAITFLGVPIWKAGGESGVVDSNSRFEFLNNGNLRLINGLGTIIWESNTTKLGVTVATLDNSGNLSLKNGTSTTVWSTFQNPTDTIVPFQNFTTRNVLSSGNYSFHLLFSGNMTLRWNNEVIYWNRGNSSLNSSLIAPNLRILPIGTIQINGLSIFYSNDYANTGKVSSIFRFIKLDSDGNLRIYSSVRDTGKVVERWAAVSDQCQVYGFCGNMGICSYKEDSNTRCGCPSENYEFTDSNDPRKGCKRKVEIEDCPGNTTMLQLDHTQFLTYEPERFFQVSPEPCSSNCLNNPPCQASTALKDGSGLCYLKTSSFTSGYQSPALPSISYVKVCKPEMPNRPLSALNRPSMNRMYKLHVWELVMVVLVTLVVLVLLEGGLWFWCCRNSSKRVRSAQYNLLEYASGAPVQFTYKDLKFSTKGFKEKLGAGGFGAVYKGALANRKVVAVKQLEGIEQGEKHFRMKVATISSTHHLNLVKLIGFCSEGRHRLLVYEFMKNGSLDNSLFTVEETSGKWLNWESRFNIALGTARGITYLHEECRDCIIHCDIKPENILLDENYNAKVSGFGLAKLIYPKDHRYITLTSVRGTRGYMAPEYLANLPTTSKSDVYSYGMVLLEIVSGRRNFEVSEGTNGKKFSMWAYEEFERDNVYNIIDKRVIDREVDMEQILRAIQVSFWCIQEQPSQRPTMGKVVQMLEGITSIEKPPIPKVMTYESGTNTNVSAHSITSPSAPPPSWSSSFQAMQIANDVERSPASLLRSIY